MKKIILLTTILVILWLQINTSIAGSGDVTIKVTEKIPWANCNTGTPVTSEWDGASSGSSTGRVSDYTYTIYECSIPKWTSAITSMLWKILEYFTFIVTLVWVLFIVYNWILYSMWGLEESMKSEAKKRIIWTLIWLALLFLAWPILKIIAPWIYK
jgi:hypothetical protein